MCSIGEDDFGDEGGVHAMIPDIKHREENGSRKSATEEFCHKCQKPGAEYLLPFRQAECRECFLLYARHKFRAALGSSKVLPKDAKVLLVFDGSAESLVLLDMLHHAQTQNTFKRLHCYVTVILIDDYKLMQKDSTEDDYKNYLYKVESILRRYTHFDSFIAPLVDVKEISNCLTDIKHIKEQFYHLKYDKEKEALISTINSIKSLTSRQDFLKNYRSKLISCIAKHFDSQFAFVADLSPKLATDLLIAVALGRGASSALDVALIDDRLGHDIKLVRPLKDLNMTEIELYVKAQNLELLNYKRFGFEVGANASLQNLTKSFVDNLQQNFSATVSTVFRTGDKIAVNRGISNNMANLSLNRDENQLTLEEHCLFCNSFLDYQDSTTLLAIEFSRLVSENGCKPDKVINFNTKARENVQGTTGKPYLKKLCHACRNICRDSPNSNLLL